MMRAWMMTFLLVIAAVAAGCEPNAERAASARETAAQSAPAVKPPDEAMAEPCPTGPGVRPPAKGEDVPRFAADSPFSADYKPPVFKEGKRLWAQSWLWADAPGLVVEKWLSAPPPKTEGKVLLIEFWATWCPPCRKSIALLNRFHERFKDELVVIGISDESEAAVRALKDHPIAYHSAIDTQARMKNQLGVFGIPHVIIVEPGGAIVWEGFPFLKGYELTEEKVEKIVAVGRDGK
jgi:thiol-disulfide isomerase/thioredoxin